MIVASIPIALLGGAAPSDTVPTMSPLLFVPLIACLMASGFFYVAILGQRLAGYRWHYWIADLLLTVPSATGIALLLSPEEQRLSFLGFVLFGPACVLFLCTIWPLHLTSVIRDRD
jgi:hypothetical protein